MPEQLAPAASPSAAAPDTRPVFKSEVATQPASQYLESYGVLLNDLSASVKPPTGSPDAITSYLSSYTQKIALDYGGVRELTEASECPVEPGRTKATVPIA